MLKIGKSAAKLRIHPRKVQRLLEGFSPLNNQLERPTGILPDDIVRTLWKHKDNKLVANAMDNQK
jgi:hypothetical protein